MNRRTAGVVLTISMLAVSFGTAGAQNSSGSAAIDASLRAAVERKDVPGVVALVTNRERVLYQGAFGVADVSTGRALPGRRAVPYRVHDQAGHLAGLDAAHRAGPHRSRRSGRRNICRNSPTRRSSNHSTRRPESIASVRHRGR